MRRYFLAAAALLLAAAIFTAVLAQTGQFELSWGSIDSGAGTSTGGDYILQAVAGQPDAGSSSGGDFTVQGGFLVPAIAPGEQQQFILLPLLQKPP